MWSDGITDLQDCVCKSTHHSAWPVAHTPPVLLELNVPIRVDFSPVKALTNFWLKQHILQLKQLGPENRCKLPKVVLCGSDPGEHSDFYITIMPLDALSYPGPLQDSPSDPPPAMPFSVGKESSGRRDMTPGASEPLPEHSLGT